MKPPKHWSDWALILGGAGLALSFAMPALAQAPATPDTTSMPPVAAPETVPQTPPPTPAPAAPPSQPSATRPPALGSTLAPVRPILATLRTEADVRADMEAARNQLMDADAALRNARAREIEARTNAEIKKRDIGALDARLKAAKQLKQEADKADLERTRKVEQARQSVFERLEEAWKSETELATARQEHANQWLRAAEAELELITKAAQLGAQNDATFPVEQRLAQMRKLLAARARSVAEREESVQDRRLRAYQAWTSLQTGK